MRVLRIALCVHLVALMAGATAAQARQKKPRRPSAKVLRAAKALFKQGRAYYDAGAYALAIKEYRKAHRLTPRPLLLFNIGQAYRLKGDKAQAIVAYQRFLAVVTEGTIAEEARNHIAALQLKIQVKKAEVAKRRAEAAAKAAQRRLAEIEAAKRRAEAAAKARIRTRRAETEQLKRLAADIAARTRKGKIADRQRYRRQLAVAKKRGRALHATGIATMVTGAVLFAVSPYFLFRWRNTNTELRDWSNEITPWSVKMDQLVREKTTSFNTALGLTISGAALLLVGGILYAVGGSQRSRAVGAVERPLSVMPLVGPGGAGVTLHGRF
jgi:tetratricopeptide (TPR) repeat protein